MLHAKKYSIKIMKVQHRTFNKLIPGSFAFGDTLFRIAVETRQGRDVCHIFASTIYYMNTTASALQEVFDRIPRRYSSENLNEINGLLSEYEALLISIEAENSFYEKSIPVYFDDLELVRSTIKNSNNKKASKKLKDNLFDEGFGKLKDSIEALIELYADGDTAQCFVRGWHDKYIAGLHLQSSSLYSGIGS